ncbi:MAG: non-canonical purine NTP pyrophosphatase [Rickettsiella sp.]|nr:non-canonical purine NTP pyrophosphatase [Rickettsiella sp.]
MNEIYYVTGNGGKFEEVADFFAKKYSKIDIKQYALNIDEIQSLDQKAVIRDKVEKAFTKVHKPLLLDDGGIFFDAYNQFPGTLSKFVFQGLGFKGLFKLLEDDNRASFILQLAYTDGIQTQLFEGVCKGTIIKPNNLASHPELPFTAIFKPNGSDRTLAELRYTADFFQYSFRQQALMKFIAWYETQ